MEHDNNNITISLKIGEIEFSASGDKKSVNREIKSFYRMLEDKHIAKFDKNDCFYDFLMPNIYKNDGYTISFYVSNADNDEVDF